MMKMQIFTYVYFFFRYSGVSDVKKRLKGVKENTLIQETQRILLLFYPLLHRYINKPERVWLCSSLLGTGVRSAELPDTATDPGLGGSSSRLSSFLLFLTAMASARNL